MDGAQRGLSGLVALAVIAGACGGGVPPAELPTLQLGIEGRSNENVSLTSLGADVVAVWSASTSDSTDIYTALSVDGGRSFMMPVRVNSDPGVARVDRGQPPRVSLVPQTGHTPDIVVVWAARDASGTRMLMSTSQYGVRPYGAATEIPRDERPSERPDSATTRSALGTVTAWVSRDGPKTVIKVAVLP
jgi:hypothetical protein